MDGTNAATPIGENPDYNPEAVISWLRQRLGDMQRQRDEAYLVIDESHRMIVDEDTGRRWKELFREAAEQIADERHDHGTTKRLVAEETTKRWILQQALEAVANTACTNGKRFCKYCNAWVGEPHRDYCVVAPVLGLSIEAPSEASDE